MRRRMIITGLTDLQADGLACITCGADYLMVPTPQVPVGRSAPSSQVFACVGCCPEGIQFAAGGALR